jgi:hypothetical protein
LAGFKPSMEMANPLKTLQENSLIHTLIRESNDRKNDFISFNMLN